MASFEVCYNWMLDSEDRNREYKVVPDAPPGAFACAGINSASFPVWYATIAALPQAERGAQVESFYSQNFWSAWYSQLTSDEVAKRVFDFSVNAGSVAAVRCLQEAVNSYPPLVVDGQWGPHTVVGVNADDPDALVEAFKDKRVAHYKAIAAAKPELAHYLQTWTARALK
jgi:lysozyme family protein